MRKTIYERAIAAAGLAPSDTVLVLCGGDYDRRVLLGANIESATVSNVDFHAGHKDYAPYVWQYQDAESVTAADESFDWCVVHAGLHHCASPHRGLCEMLRVARKGIVVVEARDSSLMRLAVKLGLTGDYELEPAAISGGKYGGFRNTNIPNFVYRWTEREVDKTIRSFLPQRSPQLRFLYGYRIPLQRLRMERNVIKRIAGTVGNSVVALARLFAPKQGNEFAFIVRKGGELQPWLKSGDKGPDVNLDYLYARYAPEKYGSKPVDNAAATTKPTAPPRDVP